MCVREDKDINTNLNPQFLEKLSSSSFFHPHPHALFTLEDKTERRRATPSLWISFPSHVSVSNTDLLTRRRYSLSSWRKLIHTSHRHHSFRHSRGCCSCAQASTMLTWMCISGSKSKNIMKKPGSTSRPRSRSPPPPPAPTPTQPRDGYRRPQRRDDDVKPPDIDDYVRPCQDFYEGRRGADPGRDQAVTRYLEDWDRMWEHISPPSTNGNGNGCFFPLLQHSGV